MILLSFPQALVIQRSEPRKSLLFLESEAEFATVFYKDC